jgi:hypothetical protein
MDKDALGLCGVLLSEYGCRKPIGHDGAHESRTFIDDLGANGYVVVPRRELDDLLDAALLTATALSVAAVNNLRSVLSAARRAVVEAVGPTREDTKP